VGLHEIKRKGLGLVSRTFLAADRARSELHARPTPSQDRGITPPRAQPAVLMDGQMFMHFKAFAPWRGIGKLCSKGKEMGVAGTSTFWTRRISQKAPPDLSDQGVLLGGEVP